MKARFVVLLFSITSTAAHAGILWDYTISGPATYSGVIGRETVTYRYDPDRITVYTCIPTLTEPCAVPDWWHHPVSSTWQSGARYTISYGPTLSVKYQGVVDGASGASEMYAFDDNGFGCTKVIGGTSFTEECGGLLFLKDPVAFVREPALPVFYPSGGEDGFNWWGGPTCPSCPLADLLVSRSLTPVPLPEPGSFGLLMLCLAALRMTHRSNA